MRQYPYLKPANSPFVDRFITKAGDLIEAWDGREAGDVGIVGVPLSKSSISHSGAAFAPGSIRKALRAFSTYSMEEDLDLNDVRITDFGDIQMHITDIMESQQRIERVLYEIFAGHRESLPIILGGDHSTSFPSISAFTKANGRVGIIQFDAHHDLRNLEDGGPSNGTPFRSLVEKNIIEGTQLVQIGIRDFSNSREYRDYADEQGVTVYTMKDVRERPIVELVNEGLKKLSDKVDAVYVSVDMDVLDQAHAPGCPAIGPGGMDSQTLLEAVSYLGGQTNVKAMDIVEIDPTVDFRDMTSRTAAHVILQFLKGKRIGGLL
ncbi:formimidoylglutamase [Pseudalkalibacillus caeni]|uniref:Formimidoylglutamase n=1 Tax=Exobacillus caeni TaxID=2574798 RepID=A0A5R9F9L0_9BACL|nr:formimidoylglutamase [Pseudalkalibacillus caeni]TLS38328.1 formimidoylglutamase [Pseudalkalibacillus caeni]